MKKILFLIFSVVIIFSANAQDSVVTAIPDSIINNYTQKITQDSINMSQINDDFLLQAEIQTQKLYKNLFLIGFIFMTMLSILLFYINNVKIKQIMNMIKIQERQIDIKTFEIEKLSIILHNTNDGVAIIDENGKIMWNNESFAIIHGIKNENLKEIELDFFKNENADIQGLIDKARKDKKPVQFSFETINNNKETIYIQRRILPISDDKNKVLNFAIIDADMTALKLATEQRK